MYIRGNPSSLGAAESEGVEVRQEGRGRQREKKRKEEAEEGRVREKRVYGGGGRKKVGREKTKV